MIDYVTNFILQQLSYVSLIPFETIVFICWIYTIIDNIRGLYKSTVFRCYQPTLLDILYGAFVQSLVYSIIEGSVLRSMIVSLTRDLEYFKEYNVLLLGLMHV